MQLNKKYNQKDFENFLVDFLPEDFVLAIKDIETEKKFNKIQKARVLGECQSLGLKVIELEHGQEKDPRIALAKEAFMLMADVWAKKALVVFKSSNSDNWRLSYMTISFNINDKNRVEKNISNPRRKSFFLGPDSKISTPDRYLLKKSRITTIEELEACFDVEVVTKEFFDNYKKLFDKLSIYLKEDEAFNAFAASNKIKIDDFAKKLLGQIVFVYFLQKKGWLGAKKEQHIYEGDANFLRNLFIKCDIEKKSYFNDFLECLFYDAFNKESERAGNFYREYFDCQIPFLNGGLFEPLNKYDWEKSFLHIPNELFSNSENSGILDIFDLYNFTIDENSLIDQEVSVDPEMLGKVFEKLLDTKKETGSFYTPREIVSYMVKQSLIEYLKIKTEVQEVSIEDLVNNHRVGNVMLQKKDFVAIENALREIKIIDPAVGSGAFPVGILQEMTEVRLLCQSQINERPKLAYDIKKEILENNIYGVDIDHGAIDIARLRFWLSLVVDADLNDVEPLPNLDFKLVAANSLLSLKGDEGFWDEKDLHLQMKELREKYFRARTKNGKEKIQNDFNKIVRKSNNLLATDRQKQLFTYNPFSSSSVAQFFDSEFMFGIKEFDVVIGNPPYIKEYTSKEAFSDLKNSPYYQGKMDLWYFFTCYGLDLLKDNGIQSFIAPNNWISNYGAKIMRNKLLNEAKICQFIDFGNYKVFDTAGIQTMVYLLKKSKNNISYELKFAKLKNDIPTKEDLNVFINSGFEENNENFYKFIFQFKRNNFEGKSIQFLRSEDDGVIDLIENAADTYLTSKEVAQGIVLPQDFLNKKNREILGDSLKVGSGVFVLSNTEKSALNLSDEELSIIKPYFVSSDFFKYGSNKKSSHWIIYTDSKFKDAREMAKYPNIKMHLDQFSKIITSDNRPYGLHRARDERFFKGEKIIVARKCISPEFAYNNFDCYVSATFYIIKTERINLKYLLAILNSNTIKYWLKNKGKMQGNNFQIDKEPLLQIPIKEAPLNEQAQIIDLVNNISRLFLEDNFNPKEPSIKQIELEKEINKIVYNIYGLTEDNINVIEKS